MINLIVTDSKFTFKKDWSDFEIRGVKSYLDDYLDVQFECEGMDAVDHFRLVYVSSGLYAALNVCHPDIVLPGAPREVMDAPVSHFALTENNALIAVFLIGSEDKEVHVLIN